jgi:chemotaxis protein CheD
MNPRYEGTDAGPKSAGEDPVSHAGGAGELPPSMSSAGLRRPPSIPPGEPARCEAYLHAGQIVVSSEPCAITAIVGSCVAVYLFDPGLCVGGGNHYVMPTAGRSDALTTRYGDVAMEALLRRFAAFGCRERDLQAKLVGGASIIQASEHIGAESLGMKNVRLAKRILARRRINVLSEDVGGTRGRKVVFQTDTGVVFIRKL